MSKTANPQNLRNARSGLTFGAPLAPARPHKPEEGLTFLAGPAPRPIAASEPAGHGLRLVASGGAIV
ncbi:MAG: hypothetical protein AAFR41_06500 [Pseudomonadota bacterium]